MQFSVIHDYAEAADTVFALLTEFEPMREKYEALGHHDVELVRREEADDGSITIETRRTVPLALPGFAKKVLSPQQRVTQTDAWSAPDAAGVRTGAFSVVASGTPVRVHGSLRLAPSATRTCTNAIDVTVECKIPLIGGKIADFVGGDTRRAVDHEHDWTARRLAS